MLPRLTDGPNCLMNQACAAFDGASKMTFMGPTASAISPISSVRMPPDESKMPAVPPSRASVTTFPAPASSSSWSHRVHSSAVYSTDESFEPTSERTMKSRAKSATSASFSSRGMSTVPSEISTCVRPSSPSQRLYSSSLPVAQTTSKNVPPITTFFSRRTSSFRRRFGVTSAVPQPSLTTSMYTPDVSRTSSHARGPRPLSRTWVMPPSRGLKPSKELLQLLLGRGLDVVIERVAVRVDPDGQRPEVLDAELPEALGHELLPGDFLDLLDLGRLERRGAADDREVDHAEPLHGLDRLVGEAALAADRPHAVLRAERLGEPNHARARRR